MVDYCNLGDVKKRLDKPVSDVACEPELEQLRDDAEAEIDSYLQKHVTVPLTGSIPALLSAVCAELIAVDYQMRRAPAPEAAQNLKTLREMALAKLNSYVNETYKRQISFVIGESSLEL